MSPTQPRSGPPAGPTEHRDRNRDPGEQIPKRPEDTTASGDARNDTGEDNQREKGGRPADDYIRR